MSESKSNRRSAFEKLILGVSEVPTEADKRAERLVRGMIKERFADAELELTNVKLEGCEPPWLYVEGAFFTGEERILSFERMTRSFAAA